MGPDTAEHYLKFARELRALQRMLFLIIPDDLRISLTFSQGMEPFGLTVAADYLEDLAHGRNARAGLLPIGSLLVDFI